MQRSAAPLVFDTASNRRWSVNKVASVEETAVREREQARAGEPAPGGDIPVENPATGEIIAHVPDLAPEQVAELARAARAAQPAWQALGFEGRARVLRRAQKWLVDNSERVISTVVAETGKTYEDAQFADYMYGVSAFGFWAKNAERYLADERVKTATPMLKGKRLVLRHRPLGLVGVIGPWNYPLTNSFGDAIPALAAGNAVIVKPSELTPLTSRLLADGLRACGLPDDVFAVATGRAATGEALVDEVDMIMFTGSTQTGRKVMARAAQTLTPVSLELGGKDPMIVLADADLERAANHAVYYSMFNGGQTCISVERVYVEAPVHDEFVVKVTEKARNLRNDRSTGPGTADVGSMTFPPQVDVVERHVEDARAKGARVLVGGHRGHDGRGGHWYEPTVLVDVDHTMDCMTEETFGPTLPIMRVADAEQAIRLANDSPYGLGASVFSRDARRGEAVARRIDAGAVCVNDALVNYNALELPMGGAKASGLGSRHGAGGIRKFTQQQALLVSRWHPRREPHMYPYRPGVTRAIGKLVALLYGRGGRR
jgi:acyl-CoA reductase-like NAD-dependent aldehyde dehydrogenase